MNIQSFDLNTFKKNTDSMAPYVDIANIDLYSVYLQKYDQNPRIFEASRDLMLLVAEGNLSITTNGLSINLKEWQGCQITRMTHYEIHGKPSSLVLHFEMKAEAARVIRDFEEVLARA